MMNWNPRKYETRSTQKSFLIVCEGEKTEVNYFVKFPVNPTIKGEGDNTMNLVDLTMKYMEEDDYDEVWVVFDKDDFESNKYNGAIQKAEAHGINVAYSNPCFELWYCLHFDYMHTQMSRGDLRAKLRREFGSYKKNDIDMYEKLIDKQKIAIRNAKKLYEENIDKTPAKAEPLTMVFRLVEALNKASE